MTTTGITVFTLMHRATRRGKWVRVGTFPSRAEAFDAMHGAGDWLIQESDDCSAASVPASGVRDDHQEEQGDG